MRKLVQNLRRLWLWNEITADDVRNYLSDGDITPEEAAWILRGEEGTDNA